MGEKMERKINVNHLKSTLESCFYKSVCNYNYGYDVKSFYHCIATTVVGASAENKVFIKTKTKNCGCYCGCNVKVFLSLRLYINCSCNRFNQRRGYL
jgi:hypothetical protein